jgi:sugar O-acyltransferase (sialic acid O-acetyltransferase NeuD family)
MKENILLLGAGGHCHSVIDVIEQEGKFSIAGIIDNEKSVGDMVLGYPVIACDDDLQELRKKYRYAVVSVGQLKSSAIRVKLFKLLKDLNFELPIIISPLAYISKYAVIKEGSIIMHDALVNANAKIDENCIINTKALIEHDAHIEKHCHISTGSIVNGGTLVEENSFLGSNCVTKEYAIIGGFIKAGSVVK